MRSDFNFFVFNVLFLSVVGFFVFQIFAGGIVLTGLAVSSPVFNVNNIPLNSDDFLLDEGNVKNEKRNVSLEDVLLAFEDIDSIILEMKVNSFSVAYVEDSLFEMKRIFDQVSYAEILRDDNLSYQEKNEARDALRLIDWENLGNEDVLVYYDDIVARKDLSFLLWDKIIIEEPVPGTVSLGNVEILEAAKSSFHEGRFSETEDLIKLFRASVEEERAERTVLAGIQRGAKNFFEKYWVFIMISFIMIVWIGVFSYKKIKRSLLRNKISKMEVEAGVLKDLMKKVQIERFEKGKVSALVYNIRMKKYNERFGEIKQELPVLKKRLKKKK